MHNKIVVAGTVLGKPEITHEILGEKFYEFDIETMRYSGVKDVVPVIVSERLFDKNLKQGDRVAYSGEVRSYNRERKLLLRLFVKDTLEDKEVENNSFNFEGVIGKKGTLRKTPLGKIILDLTIAINRKNKKSSYLPCIAWGSLAKKLDKVEVGTTIAGAGRFQSREYTKEDQRKVVYEISISHLLEEKE